MKRLYKKYDEIIRYLIIGAFSTLISIGSYSLLLKLLPINYLINNFISWIITITFAYIMNKTFVFKNKKRTKKELLVQIYKFLEYRIFSLLIDMAIMYLLVSIFKIDKMISKICVQIIIVIVNYIFSKFFVFKKN